ncbi:class I SAM-dependent methyltransferase [Bordetella sp. BOR01]|uniref:class I SAM-dependent methyltransferase n=1 Tax=Bordetella sp. BOR01 TaxID=2854779 RepID=UPI001C47A891|nr:class I SAM-dependent methyltransferase [Bordetella sp. BOR01]MBV7481698.1 class I SAM-dependent methyltransferase [Bordetella sp. BOR01]
MTIASLDFAQLYRQHLAEARAQPKPPQAWDRRAGELAQRMTVSRYAQDFIARMHLDGAHTLLDVGCGPGTLALPLAARLEQVVGLDYSSAMLDALVHNAQAQGLANVRPILRAWEDDWSDVPICDIVVASRSTVVEDMAAALAKLHAKARLRVYLTHLAGGHFIDPAIQQIVGRTRPAMPDYIYVINILHGMGIYPTLDYITVESQLAAAPDFDDYARRVARSMGGLDDRERQRLRAWYDDASPRDRIGAPLRWAFIHWQKDAGA